MNEFFKSSVGKQILGFSGLVLIVIILHLASSAYFRSLQIKKTRLEIKELERRRLG